MNKIENLLEKCKEYAFDLDFNRAKQWKSEDDSRVLVGYMPIYFPREILHAVGAMGVGVFGGSYLLIPMLCWLHSGQ